MKSRDGSFQLCMCIVVLISAGSARAQWTQWGGPERNFAGSADNLADDWPADGPRVLWKRELGVGYSAILCDGDMLYTMYRDDITEEPEYVVALNARTGETVWRHEHKTPIEGQPDQRWGGQGPNSTPLIVGDRLFTVGSRCMLYCFDKKSGKVLWSCDLKEKYGAGTGPNCGYCPSPAAYKNTIILAVGEPRAEGEGRPDGPVEVETRKRVDGHSLMAFDQKTGELVWKNMDFNVEYSSPIIVQFDGVDQVVFSSPDGLFAVRADNGDLLWHYPQSGGIITPVWNGRDAIFYDVMGEQIGVAVKLTKQSDRIVPEVLWSSRKINCGLATPVIIGDHMVVAKDNLLLGVDFTTGKRTWAKRGYQAATPVYGGGKLFILDENGRLTLAETSPERLNVVAHYQAAEKYSCTAPTLVGQTLYLRDRKHIMALDVGAPRQTRSD